MKVLTDSKYTIAAQSLSIKIRARKITPRQEAAGDHPCPSYYPDNDEAPEVHEGFCNCFGLTNS